VLDRGQRADWFNSAWVCIFTAVAVIALVLLVYRELHFPEPIVDLRILAIPLFDVSVVLILIMMLVVFGMNLLNPLFFQELLDY
jgi:DHA2 family multidrug resistance protein